MWWTAPPRVARDALAGAVYAPVGLATHYHTVQIHPYWADSLQTVGTIGAHRFYRWRGAAGARRRSATSTSATSPPPCRIRARRSRSRPPKPIRWRWRGPTKRASARRTRPRHPPRPAPVYSAEIEARGGDALFQANTAPAAGQVREEYAAAASGCSSRKSQPWPPNLAEPPAARDGALR
jgi:hypothetical protein